MNPIHPTIHSPSNTFYIGDLAYSLSTQDYENSVCKFDSGKIELRDNLSVIFYNTNHGDGKYKLYSPSETLLQKHPFVKQYKNNKDFPVDSGTLGICPIELVKNKQNLETSGAIIQFSTPVYVEHYIAKNTIEEEVCCQNCNNNHHEELDYCCHYCENDGYVYEPVEVIEHIFHFKSVDKKSDFYDLTITICS